MSTSIALRDELLDAQFTRALAYTRSGGAELGECLATARRITGTDPEQWYRQWLATAERAEHDAQRSSRAGHPTGARDAYLRAANYYRTAGIMLLGAPVDDRLRYSAHRETDTFRAGAALLPDPPEILKIPYHDTTLPGYFFPAPGSNAERRATVILTGGYDGTVEELYFAAGAAALDRGYHVLAFDGPGQGSVLIDQGIPLRPDWENVVTPVVDFTLARPDVDPDRIALIGWSLGGYLAPRAATTEHRIAACVSDCGPYDLYAAALDRVPGPLARGLPPRSAGEHTAATPAPAPNATARKLLTRALDATLKRPTGGWALRRTLLVHDLPDPMAFLAVAGEYSLKGREHLITCPTFVCSTHGDDLSATARAFAAKLTCPVEYVEFGVDDDVTGHCEITGRAVYHQRVFDWLDQTLHHPHTARTAAAAR